MINITEKQKNHQTINTDFDFDVNCRVMLTKRVEKILCRWQIRAVVGVDQKRWFCHRETLRYCAWHIRGRFRCL